MSETNPTEPKRSGARKWVQKKVEGAARQARQQDERLSANDGKIGDLYRSGKAKGSNAARSGKEKVGQARERVDSSMSEAVRSRLLAEYREAVDEALKTALQVVTAQATHIEILEKQIADLEAEHE